MPLTVINTVYRLAGVHGRSRVKSDILANRERSKGGVQPMRKPSPIHQLRLPIAVVHPAWNRREGASSARKPVRDAAANLLRTRRTSRWNASRTRPRHADALNLRQVAQGFPARSRAQEFAKPSRRARDVISITNCANPLPGAGVLRIGRSDSRRRAIDGGWRETPGPTQQFRRRC